MNLTIVKNTIADKKNLGRVRTATSNGTAKEKSTTSLEFTNTPGNPIFRPEGYTGSCGKAILYNEALREYIETNGDVYFQIAVDEAAGVAALIDVTDTMVFSIDKDGKQKPKPSYGFGFRGNSANLSGKVSALASIFPGIAEMTPGNSEHFVMEVGEMTQVNGRNTWFLTVESTEEIEEYDEDTTEEAEEEVSLD